jgi:large subunit ribosomal protein L16
MQKGRSKKRMKETRGLVLNYGRYGLQATSAAWITAAQLEAGRKAITHVLKKGGNMWIRVFPDKPITKLPPEVTLGGGKGNVEYYVVPVKPGRIIFEMDGVSRELALKALKNAGYKLPVRTRIVEKE